MNYKTSNRKFLSDIADDGTQLRSVPAGFLDADRFTIGAQIDAEQRGHNVIKRVRQNLLTWIRHRVLRMIGIRKRNEKRTIK